MNRERRRGHVPWYSHYLLVAFFLAGTWFIAPSPIASQQEPRCRESDCYTKVYCCYTWYTQEKCCTHGRKYMRTCRTSFARYKCERASGGMCEDRWISHATYNCR